MRLSPLDLQWVMNAELLPLAALTLVAGALGDRFGQKRIFLAGIALYGLGAAAIGFARVFRAEAKRVVVVYPMEEDGVLRDCGHEERWSDSHYFGRTVKTGSEQD